jgi:hypothetical protein
LGEVGVGPEHDHVVDDCFAEVDPFNLALPNPNVGERSAAVAARKRVGGRLEVDHAARDVFHRGFQLRESRRQ